MCNLFAGMEHANQSVDDQIDQALSFMEITMRGISIPTITKDSTSERQVVFNHYLGKGAYTRPYPYDQSFLDKIQSMPQFNEHHHLQSIAQGLKQNIPLHEHRIHLLAIQTARYLRFRKKIFENKIYKFVSLPVYVHN
jgi:hypothetical protein